MEHVSTTLTDHQRGLLLDDRELVAQHGQNLDRWDDNDLRRALCRKLGFEWVDASVPLVSRAEFEARPEDCRKYGFLPTYRGVISLHVFMLDPFNGTAIRRLRNLYHREIHPIGTSRLALQRTLAALELRPQSSTAAKGEAPIGEILSWNYNSDEGVKFIERILREAYARRASDVSIESYPDRIDIRFRCGGLWLVMPPLAAGHAASFMRDAKAFASMSTRESRGYRDGSAEMTMPDGNVVNLRVVAQRVLSGESITIRLLNKQTVLSLTGKLPFKDKEAEIVQTLLGLKQGMIVVCGPTGSGKTTLLWRMLLSMNSSEKKIMTVEDPVEYRFDNFVQLPVKGKVEGTQEDFPETFPTAVRSILRARPDVVLIGEIRDQETADEAVKAALTAHLILTTVHANDTVGVFTRLFDLKVEPSTLQGAILAVIAVRLVPVLCPHCRVAETTTDAQRRHYAFYGMPAPEKVYRLGACPECGMTGTRGATELFEFLVLNSALKNMVKENFDQVAFRKVWTEQGGRTIGMHALNLCSEGRISYEEARANDAVALDLGNI